MKSEPWVPIATTQLRSSPPSTIHPSITDQHQLRQGPKMFQGRKVLVVGAGLGLAGLVCASCTKAQEASGPGL